MQQGYVQSTKVSFAGHAVLIAMVLVFSMWRGCTRQPREMPSVFTVVTEQGPISPDPKDAPARPTPKPAPPQDPEPMRDPAPPPPLPPAPVLPVDKQDTMVLNKKPDKQPAPKPPDPKPAPPEVKIGPRIVRSASTPPRPVRVAPKLSAAEIERLLRQAGSASGARTTHAQMSAAEIERQLKNGALSGVANSIPDDEISRCMLLIKRALYAAWDPPSRADAGPRPAELELRFGTGGRIISTRLTQPSGSVGYDRSVTAAAAAVDHVDGLTTAFLQRYDYRLTVEFKLEE